MVEFWIGTLVLVTTFLGMVFIIAAGGLVGFYVGVKLVNIGVSIGRTYRHD